MSDSTSVDRKIILEAIFASIDEINETQSEDRKLKKSIETHLFDKQGMLDSLGLVSFIVDLEQRVAEISGIAVTLADEKALSRQTSPFSTVSSLADYVIETLRGSRNG